MAVKIKKEWVCEKCGEFKTDDSNLLGAIMKNRYPAGWAKMVRFGNSKPVTKKIINFIKDKIAGDEANYGDW
jgi:hypothetical protein